MFFSFPDLSSSFLVFLMNLAYYRLSLSTLHYFSAVTTLVTLSGKEKDSLGPEASTSSLGLGIGSSILEPGTKRHYLICSRKF
jgi:hypothetical protein